MDKVIQSSPITDFSFIPDEFHVHINELKMAFGIMGGSCLYEMIPDAFSQKGWNLHPYSDSFLEMISESPVESIQFNASYVPLPKNLLSYPIFKSKNELFNNLNTAPLYFQIYAENNGKNLVKVIGVHPIDWIRFEEGGLSLEIDPKIAKALGKQTSEEGPYTIRIKAEDIPYLFPHIKSCRPIKEFPSKIEKVISDGELLN